MGSLLYTDTARNGQEIGTDKEEILGVADSAGRGELAADPSSYPALMAPAYS